MEGSRGEGVGEEWGVGQEEEEEGGDCFFCK